MNPTLDRGLGLKEATALNMIDMVGIGPFIVMPLVIQTMGGPQSFLAWIAGALLALADGFIWAELGAKMPKAGGSYVFLREIYGKDRWGKLMSFLLIWQVIIQAPLVVASGAIGFSQYLTYLVPLSAAGKKIVSGALVILLIVLLYRKITTIGKISLFLWIGVIGTILWLVFGGVTHFNPALAFDFPEGAFNFSWIFFVALGQASVKTVYSYLGYYNVCHLGSEIQSPEKNIPRSIFISIAGIAVLYLAMQWSVMGVLPWREAQHSEFIVSSFIEKIYGPMAASIATVLVLWIAFASLFAVLLGYSRIPYAAAADGTFFSVFAKVHPTKHFPHVSLLVLGATAFVFSLLFKLTQVITAILAMRILVQFIGQAVGVWRLHKHEDILPFRMPLFPLPSIIAIVAWGLIFLSTGLEFALGGITVIALGVIAFLLRARWKKEWPFAAAIILLLSIIAVPASGQISDPVKILIITAHPDDETACAAVVYKTTHTLNGVVDLAVITNGEAGYRYSTLAEPIYNMKLTDEKTARQYLPSIRKKELMAGGKIIGIRNYYFLDQTDNHFTLDADTVLKQVWNVAWVKERLREIMMKNGYNFIFTMLPTEQTHGHHKAAAIIALETLAGLQSGERPLILGMSVSRKSETSQTSFKGLKGYPITEVNTTMPPAVFDLTKKFGFNNRLDYKIIVNWLIAEHKSQGAMQAGMNEGDNEEFYFFSLNPPNRHGEVKDFFRWLNEE